MKMLSIQEIKNQYPTDLHKFDRGLLREYLQYQILGIIFSHKIGLKLSFLGGTCLRIVHKSKRFSEDLDFDNKNLTLHEFKELSNYIKRKLELLGYTVELKEFRKLAFHCYIKFPKLLFKEGLSPLEKEKVLIHLDTFDQGVNYKSGRFILNKFDIFDQILTTPKEIILSQKLWTITQRKRAKGRDFYDIMFLFQNTKPDISFLKVKFGTDDRDLIKEEIINHCNGFNWDYLVNDVSPFLQTNEDAEKIRLFPKFLEQITF
ncbi:nucleotidyl transferase AbiEii/AbiGii toxin family protein [Candidatus Dojkabacteria bacterium]|nr:nucleotidyl transferase AbiEii/AbiGii toxin family protein [Candidatus Dojkabacteria bacterium]